MNWLIVRRIPHTHVELCDLAVLFHSRHACCRWFPDTFFYLRISPKNFQRTDRAQLFVGRAERGMFCAGVQAGIHFAPRPPRLWEISGGLPSVIKIAGAVIVLFGLHLSGALPIKWLYYEKRFSSSSVSSGAMGAFVMGFAFAFGWTPCIGPVRGHPYTRGSAGYLGQGVALLAVYSLGLGLPFIATALSINAFLQFSANTKVHSVGRDFCRGTADFRRGIDFHQPAHHDYRISSRMAVKIRSVVFSLLKGEKKWVCVFSFFLLFLHQHRLNP